MLLVLFNPWIGPLSGATTPGQSGPGSDGNEGVLHIPQSTAGTSPSDCLVSYLGHSCGVGSYPSAEKQSVYSTAPADLATFKKEIKLIYLFRCFVPVSSFLFLPSGMSFIPMKHFQNTVDFIIFFLEIKQLDFHLQLAI